MCHTLTFKQKHPCHMARTEKVHQHEVTCFFPRSVSQLWAMGMWFLWPSWVASWPLPASLLELFSMVCPSLSSLTSSRTTTPSSKPRSTIRLWWNVASCWRGASDASWICVFIPQKKTKHRVNISSGGDLQAQSLHLCTWWGTMSPAENKSKPSCMTAITVKTSDLYVYDVYSIMHVSDVLCLFFVYLSKSDFTKVLASQDFVHGHSCILHSCLSNSINHSALYLLLCWRLKGPD